MRVPVASEFFEPLPHIPCAILVKVFLNALELNLAILMPLCKDWPFYKPAGLLT